MTALLLCAAGMLIVPLSLELLSSAGKSYYFSRLHTEITPRSLAGTAAYFLKLSPMGFCLMMQLFKLAWLVLLCACVFHYVRSPYAAFCLCGLFAFSSVGYITNASGGFVDMIRHYLLLSAALLLVSAIDRRSHVMGLVAALLMFLAVMTHEIALFGCALLLLWLLFRRWQLFLSVSCVFALLTLPYLWVIWNKYVYGLPAADYLLDLSKNSQRLLAGKGNYSLLYGVAVFLSVGMLWPVCAALAAATVRAAGAFWPACREVVFVLLALPVCLLPLLIGADTQRMCDGVWLLGVLLLMGGVWQKTYGRTWRALVWTGLLGAQLALPPVLLYPPHYITFNAYSAQAFHYLEMLEKQMKKKGKMGQGGAPSMKSSESTR